MVFELASKLHEDLLGGDRVAQLLDHLLDLVVEFGLSTDDVESLDELLHDLLRVLLVFGGKHADEEHDALHQSGVVEVQVLDEPLEDVLMQVNQILTELLKKLSVPLDDCFLGLTTALQFPTELLFQSPEDVLKLVFVVQNLDHGSQETTIECLNESLVFMINSARVL